MKTHSQMLAEQHIMAVDWVNMYLEELTDDELKEEVIAGGNHGVWILGHIIASDDDLSLYINKEPLLYPEYQKMFGQGSTLKPFAEYPAIPLLREQWKSACDKNEKLFAGLTDDMLEQPHEMLKGKIEDDYFKTKERCITAWTLHQVHEAGQLALLLSKAGRHLI